MHLDHASALPHDELPFHMWSCVELYSNNSILLAQISLNSTVEISEANRTIT